MVEDDDELAQCVALTLKTNKGEYLLNPDHGFDRTTVQVKNYDQTVVTDAISAAILENGRVDKIESIDFNFDAASRNLSVDFAFVKPDGTTVGGSV